MARQLGIVAVDGVRRNADRLSWSRIIDELLAKLYILNGRDVDITADASRTANSLRYA